jgi:hypothetical protein
MWTGHRAPPAGPALGSDRLCSTLQHLTRWVEMIQRANFCGKLSYPSNCTYILKTKSQLLRAHRMTEAKNIRCIGPGRDSET